MSDLVPVSQPVADEPPPRQTSAGENEHVFGCAECGTFYDEAPDDRICSRCGSPSVIDLGGTPNAEKAGALIAWARRDATELLEARGAVIGAFAALIVALVVVSVFAGFGAAAIIVVIYSGIVGALAGWLAAVPAHRRFFPKSRLQPLVNANGRRWLWGCLIAMLLVPALGLPLISVVSDGRTVGEQIRLWLGQLLSALSG